LGAVPELDGGQGIAAQHPPITPGQESQPEDPEGQGKPGCPARRLDVTDTPGIVVRLEPGG
jgi:hypothetical protein